MHMNELNCKSIKFRINQNKKVRLTFVRQFVFAKIEDKKKSAATMVLRHCDQMNDQKENKSNRKKKLNKMKTLRATSID